MQLLNDLLVLLLFLLLCQLLCAGAQVEPLIEVVRRGEDLG